MKSGFFVIEIILRIFPYNINYFAKQNEDEKLSQVEKMYSSQAEKEKEAGAVHAEQQILTYRRKCEQRKKEELEAEVYMYIIWKSCQYFEL